MKASEVAQHDPVVYAINGKEYSGVALGAPALSHHPGLKSFSLHLNLIYLNESGFPVRVYGAPLLDGAATEDEVTAIAQAEEKLHPVVVEKPGGKVRDVAAGVAAAKKALAARKVSVGWRPFDGGTRNAELAAENAQLRARVAELEASLAAAAGDTSN